MSCYSSSLVTCCGHMGFLGTLMVSRPLLFLFYLLRMGYTCNSHPHFIATSTHLCTSWRPAVLVVLPTVGTCPGLVICFSGRAHTCHIQGLGSVCRTTNNKYSSTIQCPPVFCLYFLSQYSTVYLLFPFWSKLCMRLISGNNAIAILNYFKAIRVTVGKN